MSVVISLKSVVISFLAIMILVSTGVYGQDNDPLRGLLQQNSRRISELEEALRNISDKSDLIVRSKSSEKKVIEELERRILILETTIRKLEESIAAGGVEATSNQADIEVAEQIEFEGDQKYLSNFDEKDDRLSESALFSTAYTFGNIGKHKKARGYFEKFRQKYPKSSLYSTTLYLSGLNALEMKDYQACSGFLDSYIAAGSTENIAQARWTLANCLLRQGDDDRAKSLFTAISKDESSPFQVEARKILSR